MSAIARSRWGVVVAYAVLGAAATQVLWRGDRFAWALAGQLLVAVAIGDAR